MAKRVCVVLPPHHGKEERVRFKEVLLDAFLPVSSSVEFLAQPEAALLHYLHDSQENEMDIVIVCHMEEEITVKYPTWL